MMRRISIVACGLLFVASGQTTLAEATSQEDAEIAMATEAQCDKPAVRLDSVRDEPIVTGLREKLIAGVIPGYAHVREIRQPIRRVNGEQIGAPNLLRPGAEISVVGPLTNQQVRSLLEMVEERVSDTTQVTGDQHFAVVQVGDPRRDPCCTATVLFENKDGVWTNQGTITQSH